MTNVPFWEIYRQLNSQHEVTFSTSAAGIQLVRNSNTWSYAFVGSGAGVFMQPLTPQGAARGGAGGARHRLAPEPAPRDRRRDPDAGRDAVALAE